jgi:hypothetical protein
MKPNNKAQGSNKDFERALRIAMAQPYHNSLCRIARPKRFATRRHRPSPMAVDDPLLESRMAVDNPPLWASIAYDQWWLNRAATSSEEVFVPLPAMASKVSRPLVCRGWRAFRVSRPKSSTSIMDIELMTKLPSNQQAASAKSNMEVGSPILRRRPGHRSQKRPFSLFVQEISSTKHRTVKRYKLSSNSSDPASLSAPASVLHLMPLSRTRETVALSSLVSPCLVLPAALASALYSMTTAKEAAAVSEEQVHPSEPAPEPKCPALISEECPAFIGEEQLVLLSEKRSNSSDEKPQDISSDDEPQDIKRSYKGDRESSSSENDCYIPRPQAIKPSRKIGWKCPSSDDDFSIPPPQSIKPSNKRDREHSSSDDECSIAPVWFKRQRFLNEPPSLSSSRDSSPCTSPRLPFRKSIPQPPVRATSASSSSSSCPVGSSKNFEHDGSSCDNQQPTAVPEKVKAAEVADFDQQEISSPNGIPLLVLPYVPLSPALPFACTESPIQHFFGLPEANSLVELKPLVSLFFGFAILKYFGKYLTNKMFNLAEAS